VSGPASGPDFSSALSGFLYENVGMLRHGDIWLAVDRLAAERGLSPSGLARQAGLDPTTFNKSKRNAADGRLRWPSTESIAKILAATGATLGQFVSLIDEVRTGPETTLPGLGLGRAASGGVFDGNGRPRGRGWDEIPFPGVTDPAAYALEIAGDGFAPVYRDGDVVVVSPAAPVRRGDRVAVMARTGELVLKQLFRKSARRVELASVTGHGAPLVLPVADILWMSRIVWASQ
jgi:phage repressor protein C with HTH and peptisase S24 domain